jgi:succinyl-diaminopimelate desuccinylase
LNDVLRLVLVPSVSRSEGELADHVAAELQRIDGLVVDRIGNNVVARTTGERTRRVILAGHLDTVPGDASTSKIKGDRLYGVGACDMKGSLAGFLELAREHSTFKSETTWVFYAREEIARSESGLLEIHGERPDLLAGDVAIVGEPTNGAIEAGCQGSVRVRVVFGGVRAHTARPFMGVNAIHRLGGLLRAVEAYESRVVAIDGVEFAEQLQAVSISGGVASNVVPDEASLVVNFRFAPDRSGDEAKSFVSSLFAPHLEPQDVVTFEDVAPAGSAALSDAELSRLVALTGVPARAKVGWTDVATFSQWGVPATNFGAGNPMLAHSEGEFITEYDMNRYVEVLRSWLLA